MSELCYVCDDPISKLKSGKWIHDGPARSGKPWRHDARPYPPTTTNPAADVATTS